MDKSYKVLKKAVDTIGVKMLAAEMNLSPSLIYKWCEEQNNDDNDSASGTPNPLDRLFEIYQLTHEQALIDWICQMADGYFVANPKLKKSVPKKLDVARHIHGLIKEFSETLDTISNAYYDDENISNNEAKLIRKEWEELKQVGESFIHACEQGHYRKKV